MILHRLIASAAASIMLATGILSAQETWEARWIGLQEYRSETNTWLAFKKTVDIHEVPHEVTARIAVDSKYWLWINDSLVVFEGGLKRGPAPGDSYYDEVDIAPFLKNGENRISVLVWYFGRNGFSHAGSGLAGLLFEAKGDGVQILSDKTWEATAVNAYSSAGEPEANYRLPESNLRYDARKEMGDWRASSAKRLGSAMELPVIVGQPPFGKLVRRPIPLWKTSGLLDYPEIHRSGDTLVCSLPYNAQITPYLKVKAPAGKTIKMQTDHYKVALARTQCLWAEYVTKEGVQEYESLGWLNGDKMMYILPSDVEVIDVKYRETGYGTEISGSFECDDQFLNEYWRKAVRTLYVCMRDTYMDCPDRERGQWWGDEVNELGMAFYSLSPSSWKLAVKGIYELMNWQRVDGVISSPIPAFNYSAELPSQMLAALGWYGFYTQYFFSGDNSFVPAVYDRMKKYLHEVWKLDGDGLPIYREGDWDWPDADSPVDKFALMPCLYYLALKGELEFARMLDRTDDVAMIESVMGKMKDSYNRLYWTGDGYRSSSYKDRTDDRPQAMAVLAGIASEEKYPAISEILKTTDMASTYMEKYMVEALFVMGQSSAALGRMKRRMSKIMDDRSSTLYEHWNWTNSSNHAWSGANIILLSQKVCGVSPLTPGFEMFTVRPQLGWLKHASCSFETAYGEIKVSIDRKTTKSKTAVLEIDVPERAIAVIPVASSKTVTLGAGHHTVRVAVL